MRSKVFIDDFKGHKLFAVWEVDDNGEKVGNFPIVSVGSKKAATILQHLQELQEYVDHSKKEYERRGGK